MKGKYPLGLETHTGAKENFFLNGKGFGGQEIGLSEGLLFDIFL